MRFGKCPACRMGDHKHHVRNYDPVPEGMMGGSVCACEGGCKLEIPPELALIHKAMKRKERVRGLQG